MEPKSPVGHFVRDIWPLLILCGGLIILVAIIQMIGDPITSRSLTEALIRMVVVVGLYIFIGNSGIMSFGHIAFMMIGAYATAWQTIPVMTKDIFIPGLPQYLLENNHHWIIAVVSGGLLAALVALVSGIALMRLSGIAASIATFALFMSLYSFYLQWSTWTAGQSSLVGLAMITDPWIGLIFSIITIAGAFVYSQSRFGLALRASRDDVGAARAAGVNVNLQRLIAFCISAFFVGMAGGLYGHFLGLLTVDTFYLPLTFITLSMLVVGGMQSLSGAVVGVVVVSFVIEFLKVLEKGINPGIEISLPANSAEVGLGIILLVILIFRRTGLTRNAEIHWPWKPKVVVSNVMRRQS